jgi:hypothetical protein
VRAIICGGVKFIEFILAETFDAQAVEAKGASGEQEDCQQGCENMATDDARAAIFE